MKICITGQSGFLGGHLKAHLESNGNFVYNLSFRPGEADKFEQDLSQMLSKNRIDFFINAGAAQLTQDDPVSISQLLLSNVYVPSIIAYYIREISPTTCFINFGTSWQIDENGKNNPFNAYASSKNACDAFLDHYALDGVKITTLRLYDTYGASDKRKKIVNLISDALIQNAELPMSGGDQKINLVHIYDVLDAISIVISQMRDKNFFGHKIYSVKTNEDLTINQVLDMLIILTNSEQANNINKGVYPYRKRERFTLFPNTECPPGWKPKISIQEGLEMLINERKVNRTA
jgi:nucleoside-diphosphate-sugar epimerase